MRIVTKLAYRKSAAWLLLVAVCTCSRPTAPTTPPPKVDVVQPLAREVTDWDEYTARLDAVESVEVRPRVSGYLQSIYFRDGAMVNKGDCMFLIDPRPYDAALRHAEADLALAQSRLVLAQKNLARGVGLIRDRAISREEEDIRESNVRQAEASVQEAQAAVDAAKLDVEFTRITAPISGRTSRKLVTEGNLINGGIGTQGTLLTTIVSLDPIYAYFEADERSFLKYVHLARNGQRPSSREYRHPVWIGLADEDGFPRQGTMDFVDNQLDRGTGTMVGRAVFPNPDLTLSPGLFARLRFPGSGQYQAVLLPDEAVLSDQAQKFVYVVDAENKALYRPVNIGPLMDGLRVIREGLTSDDWVIVHGTQRARPSLKVDARRLAGLNPTPAQSTLSTSQAAPTPSPRSEDHG
jgi:membrane fusion protein, multidrug efflux system